ncbi:B3/B4 tRNA-binding domain-containing protein [Lentithecium fluviatile CBS 122367]|uniref:B3/B4 tRNA-binding domain-containing protein n=1 Tax=Lentithecium fluviatile CBS 122367 TaxID=1168545 RepID=A0A6G1J2T8_9PLEO|nr:B3/B4 tRNA-binding domain-containing protein [Lentithecium fluviatile CBS 122367]
MSAASKTFLNGAKISQDIFKLRPDYRALLIVVEGIPTGPSDATSERFLQAAESSAREVLSKQSVNDVPHIAAWREAYKGFGAKPKKERNSLEALMRRAEGGLPRVNRLTDIYNAISIKHQIPLGGEDLDKYSGPPFLIRSTGQEKFETTSAGETVTELPPVGEVVWCDDAGVTCRRWNWRQCTRTALSDETTRVLFILDALESCSGDALQAAADELVEILSGLSPDVTTSRRLFRAP